MRRALPARTLLVAALLVASQAAHAARAGQAAPATTPAAPAIPDDPATLTYTPLRFSFPKPERFTLGSGLVVYLLRDPDLPVIDLSFFARGGSVWDPPGREGLADLASQLMRTGGTDKLDPDAVDTRLEFLPATISIDAAYDALSGDLSCVREAFPEALDILAGMLLRPRFDAARLEVERARMIEAIRRRWDSPGPIASLNFRRLVYGEASPWAALDTAESVGRITRDDLVAFQKRSLRPASTIMAVSGDFEPAEMKRRLRAVFGDWRGGAADQATVTPVEDRVRPGVYLVDRTLPQTTIALGHLGVGRFDPDKFPLFLLNHILGEGGFSSRLMQEVRSARGLAYSVGGGVGSDSDRGLFSISCRTKAASTVQAIDAIRDVVRRLVEEGPTDEEIRRAREARVNSFVFTVDGTAAYMRSALYYRYYGYPDDYLATWRDRLQAVTRADIMRAAKRLVHLDRLVVLVVGDEKSFDRPLADLGLGEPRLIRLGDAGAPAAAPSR
jgi:predicted Zn-dependent peptidase